jgi:hypothetical protein
MRKTSRHPGYVRCRLEIVERLRRSDEKGVTRNCADRSASKPAIRQIIGNIPRLLDATISSLDRLRPAEGEASQCDCI